MKSSHPADANSAPTHYSPSVPMTVYRELAAELRANQAVIDSLNSRNQQLLSQNQMLKQEIHNVVQAALQLGQFAGVARQTAGDGTNQNFRQDFPNAIAPDTLAKLVRKEPGPTTPQPPNVASATPRNRVPRPIAQNPAKHSMKAPAVKPAAQESARESAREAAREASRISERANIARQQAPQQRKPTVKRAEVPMRSVMAQTPSPKLFTEKAGSYQKVSLESSEDKEIGGIWLALSIILIIVTAFGAGFLIMKPLLNDR